MRISNRTLAKVCLGILILTPVAAILVWFFTDYQSNRGTIAAVLAANAGTALLVSLVFSFHEFKNHTTSELRYLTVFAGACSGILSAVFWIMEEVQNLYLPIVLVAPLVVTLIVLFMFTKRVSEKGTSSDGA